MSSLLDKISEDIDAYLDLCRKYKEAPVYSEPSSPRHCSMPDCYGTHAKQLQKREAA